MRGNNKDNVGDLKKNGVSMEEGMSSGRERRGEGEAPFFFSCHFVLFCFEEEKKGQPKWHRVQEHVCV